MKCKKTVYTEKEFFDALVRNDIAAVEEMFNNEIDIDVKNADEFCKFCNRVSEHASYDMLDLFSWKNGKFNCKWDTINQPDENGDVVIVSVAGDCLHQFEMQFCINIGANANAQDERKSTALMSAVKVSNYANIASLLNAKADLDIKDKYGASALDYALLQAQDGEPQTAIILVNAGANISKEGIFSIASASKNLDLIKAFVEHGANVNDCNKSLDGRTALMNGAVIGSRAIVSYLLKQGADINMADDNGRTALMFASSRGHKDVVSMLLDAGADCDAKTIDGLTAVDFAANEDIKNSIQRYNNNKLVLETANRKRTEKSKEPFAWEY